jgi:hypothetical protein
MTDVEEFPELDAALEIAGTTMTEDQLPHAMILIEAIKIYLEKDPVRGSMWRDFGAEDKVRELIERSRRIEVALGHMDSSLPGHDKHMCEVMIEDALDLINYSVFFIRQLREDIEETG